MISVENRENNIGGTCEKANLGCLPNGKKSKGRVRKEPKLRALRQVGNIYLTTLYNALTSRRAPITLTTDRSCWLFVSWKSRNSDKTGPVSSGVKVEESLVARRVVQLARDNRKKVVSRVSGAPATQQQHRQRPSEMMFEESSRTSGNRYLGLLKSRIAREREELPARWEWKRKKSQRGWDGPPVDVVVPCGSRQPPAIYRLFAPVWGALWDTADLRTDRPITFRGTPIISFALTTIYFFNIFLGY